MQGGSSGHRKRTKTQSTEDEPEIIAGLSGDEVDPGLIIAGGRGGRRGRGAAGGGAPPRAKYQKQAALESDEDEW